MSLYKCNHCFSIEDSDEEDSFIDPENDCFLICSTCHEIYQEEKSKKIHFDSIPIYH